MSLVRHTSGVVLEQRAVEDKSNEIVAVPHLLQGKDLTGTVTTIDSLLTQRSIADQIRHTGRRYLMVVKHNHPQLWAAIAECFEDPPWLVSERALTVSMCTPRKGMDGWKRAHWRAVGG